MDLMYSAFAGGILSIGLIWYNTRHSTLYKEMYEKTSKQSSKDIPKPLSKSNNKSVETLEKLYGVKELDVIQDQRFHNADDSSDIDHNRRHHDHDPNHDDNDVDIDNVNGNYIINRSDREPMNDHLYIIEWAIFLLFLALLGYLINETTDGDLARVVAGIFPREFEVLGWKEYVERIRRKQK